MKKEEYERLPAVVEINGLGIPNLTAECVERTDKKAIYLRNDDVYEVFKIKIAQPSEMFGRTYGRRETYPSSEEFGFRAWCFRDESMAMKKYAKI